MKNRIFALILAGALIFAFGGCFGREEEPNNSESNSSGTGEEELVLYHSGGEISEGLAALAEKYSSSTGKKITVKQGGNDLLGEIRSGSGALFVADSHSDLSDWHEKGAFTDIMNTPTLSSLPNVPAGLQLNPAGIGSYGLPLSLEGFGLIVDKTLLDALFEESADMLIEDLRACSFTDFEGFVAAVDTYISAPSAAKVNVNGNEYKFKAEKDSKAVALTGVFAFQTENTRAEEQLLSAALASIFGSRYEVLSTDSDGVSKMSTVLSAYTEALDFMTGYMAGTEGAIKRGEEFTGGDYNYSTSVDLFAHNYALFYPGSTSFAADFEKSVPGFSKNLDIIPLKLPLTDEQISAAGMTAKKLQSSIVISSRYYFGIDPKASDEMSTAAGDFLKWLTGEGGSSAYSAAFGGVPYNYSYIPSTGELAPEQSENGVSTENGTSSEGASTESSGAPGKAGEANEGGGGGESAAAPSEENPETSLPGKPSHQIESSLYASVARYYAEGRWIPDMAASLPKDFSEKVLGENLKTYHGMENWTEKDRGNFASAIMNGWKDLIDKAETAVG